MICFYEPAFSDDNQKEEYINEQKELSKDIEEYARPDIEGVDTAGIESLMNKENRLLYIAMSNTINEVLGDGFTEGSLKESDRILDKHKWLVSYWIDLLQKEGYLKPDGNKYSFTEKC